MQGSLLSSLLILLQLGIASGECPTIQPYCASNATHNRKTICGAAGVLKAKGERLRSACFRSFEDCRNICFANARCKAFLFDEMEANCLLYRVHARRSRLRKASSETSLVYDTECFIYQPLDKSNLTFYAVTNNEDNGMYPAFADRGSESVIILGDRDGASTFMLSNVSGYLSTKNATGGRVIANQNDADFGQELYFNTPDVIRTNGYSAAVCTLGSDLGLNCTTGHERNVMFDDGGVVALANSTDAAGYPLLTLKADCPM